MAKGTDVITIGDTTIAYNAFITDLATEIAVQMRKKPKDEYISQNEAFARYGRHEVTRWVKAGWIEPKLSSRAKNSKKLFRVSELEKLHHKTQNYTI